MNRRQFLRIGAPVAAPLLVARRSAAAPAVSLQTPPAPAPGADGWIALFNGRNLDGWYTYLQRSGRNPANIDEYVRVENGLLHILDRDVDAGQTESGFLSTLTEYENVRIRVEYKWGVKRFAPRLENKRDNGLLYYVVGPDHVFPRCIECQIQETDVGDVFFVDKTRGVQGGLPGFGGSGFIGLVNGTPNARPGVSTSRLLKDGDFENRDDWNTVEVIAQGDRATQLVNGRIVNRLMNLEQPDPDHDGQFIPLTRGRIGIEIEFAEIWYRRIDVKPLA